MELGPLLGIRTQRRGPVDSNCLANLFCLFCTAEKREEGVLGKGDVTYGTPGRFILQWFNGIVM